MPAGFLKGLEEIRGNNVLLAVDESDGSMPDRQDSHSSTRVDPDLIIMGKALGRRFPVSAVAADKEVLGVFQPGSMVRPSGQPWPALSPLRLSMCSSMKNVRKGLRARRVFHGRA